MFVHPVLVAFIHSHFGCEGGGRANEIGLHVSLSAFKSLSLLLQVLVCFGFLNIFISTLLLCFSYHGCPYRNDVRCLGLSVAKNRQTHTGKSHMCTPITQFQAE